MMIHHRRFRGKNPNLLSSLMTPKSPCRSPNRRINSISRYPIKTRRIWPATLDPPISTL